MLKHAAIHVFFDAWCPLCTATKERTERLDWFGLVAFKSIRDDGVSDALGISGDRLEKRMHVLLVDSGRIVEGIHAVAALAARIPVYMPVYPAIQFATWIGIGEPLYDYIAKRRAIVPVGKCHDGICELPARNA